MGDNPIMEAVALMEPVALKMSVVTLDHVALSSIAISLKRIADTMNPHPPRLPDFCKHGDPLMDCLECRPF